MHQGTSGECLGAYREGQDVNRQAAYLPLCEQLGILRDAFLAASRSAAARSRARKQASGFPTLLLQTGDVTQVLESGYAPPEEITRAVDAVLQPALDNR
ncbi:hypothetical protein [Lewinella sp. IMCC34191]|uniref:hypothetical protein n=1 Tax=Lewinella sp. IMCC34191 TaxID=2259172 RepID=UPI000E280151|nr:hypothetical protein [Lewinella sp. IMCC34191]